MATNSLFYKCTFFALFISVQHCLYLYLQKYHPKSFLFRFHDFSLKTWKGLPKGSRTHYLSSIITAEIIKVVVSGGVVQGLLFLYNLYKCL